VTFSIAASDPAASQVGIAVASKFLAVGAVVPWARAGVGAVATQAAANVSYGPKGLELLAGGATPTEAIDRVTGEDDGRDQRQLGIVDARGASATFTGTQCMDWAGGRRGEGYAAQGNILAGAAVVDALAETFEGARGSLAERLLSALAAGDAAGGDRRGRQSAALLVCQPRGGYGGGSDILVDLRVDDHADPVSELRRLHGLHELLFGRTAPDQLLVLDGELADEVGALLARLGYPPDGDVSAALDRWAGVENLEERTVTGRIDPVVLRELRRQAEAAPTSTPP
jgi:uncharacterized Ntn-hydrolase superfamily protein